MIHIDFCHTLRALILVVVTMLSACRQTSPEQASHDHTHHHHHDHDYSDYGPMVFPSKHPDQVILNLTENPLETVAVNWRTDTRVSGGEVQLAEATHGPEFRNDPRSIRATTEPFEHKYEDEPVVKAHYHSAVLDGLLPGQTYVYRVGYEEAWSEWFQIRIPSPAEDGLSFIYFGDAQNDVKSMWSRVIREAYSTMPEVDFMLHAGDLINRFDRDKEWGEWFHAGSFIHAIIPSVMTPGNHEYGDLVLSPQWKPQFNLPTNGPDGLDETCYQVNYPELKIISLDAEQIDESEALREAQAMWLDSILTHDARRWTALTLHYPFYSTKPNRDNPVLRAKFKPILDKHKVDIVLQGHDHAYGRGMVTNHPTGASHRDEESGTMYVVSVSGPKMYGVSDDPWMQRRAGNTQLFQIITIQDGTLSFKAYTATGDLYDAFDLIKRPGRPNLLVEKQVEVGERVL